MRPQPKRLQRPQTAKPAGKSSAPAKPAANSKSKKTKAVVSKGSRSGPSAALGKKAGAAPIQTEADLQARIRELIKLAKEQGYLTFDDLNEALPEGLTDADDLDAILIRLRKMEIDIIEASEVDRFKDARRTPKKRKKKSPRPNSISSMTRCACISSRWGRSRC